MYYSTRAGAAIAMKQGTMKKAKDTRLLITYTTLTCLYRVIIQKKPCTSLSHHTKHTKHHDNVNNEWLFFLESKTLIDVQKLLGVVISFWSSRIIDLLVITTPVSYIRQEYE